MTEQYLFVYGTLKRGLSNHHYLGSARYVAQGITQQRFALYTIEYPFLSKSPACYQVRGELYLIDAQDLAQVDVLEQHPSDYCRELTSIIADDGQVISAWAYFHPQPRGRLLPRGEFEPAQIAL
ncbi:gamma-glutamylcyclotransferase [Chitinibacter bivalviorum]|uniref:Gamma-glutamylcyclotransferase family protein n=1 Tax=Chitinibacter bivalviorum TaxID=2739434 RepID=A0A7H9BIY4_9NEIS|nr:gamma-glutamylcyclotransferase family protein [Chitinibacter bivalviorum]QLG87524.1 gamma-glutamylcyclotransferase [Chitinibacter bivalviorum]